MCKIKMHLFGYPRILIDGSEIEVDRRKSLALLAYLAVTGEPHSRETLASLFWPEKNSQRASGNLRNLLYSLNETTIAPALKVTRKSISFSTGLDTWVDVTVFRQLISDDAECDHSPATFCKQCLQAYTRAVDMFQGGFLAGFAIRDSADFEQWQMMEVNALQQEYTHALEKLITFHEKHRDWDRVIDYTRRIIALDTLDDSAHLRLMNTYAKLGKKSDAIRLYQAYCETLRRELDLAPDPEVTERYEAIVSGDTPALSAQEIRREPQRRLPHHATPFIGRARELARIASILEEPSNRLLTLIGPGGSGKTRLALQAAEAMVEQKTDGVVWVPLASVDSVDFIVSAIAKHLDLQIARVEIGTETSALTDLSELKTQLILYLEQREMLLVVDNFEHLLAGAGILAEIIRATHGIQFLVTSRERLNLRGEQVFETDGLTLPDGNPGEVIEDVDAVRLFVQCAQHATGTFTLNRRNMESVTEICRRVRGIPLAIELAASWVKVLRCGEIVQEIQSNLDFLTSSLQDMPPRHKSIRAVFEQSWRLLTPEGRACFRKLAVLRSGFNRQAASDIARATYPALASLMDKSIIQRVADDRFEIHELLRQFAEEKLETVPRESEIVRTRHARHYLSRLQNMETPLKQGDQKKAVREIDTDIENIRSAWLWSAKHGHWEVLLDASMSLFLYYDLKNQFQDGLDMFRKAYQSLEPVFMELNHGTDCSTDGKRCLAGFLLGIRGWFMRYSEPVVSYDFSQSGSVEIEAFRLMNKGLEYLEPCKEHVEWAVINILSIFLKREWTQKHTIDRLQQCLEIFNDNPWGTALTYHTMACWYDHCDLARAEDYQKKSLSLRLEIGDAWGAAMSHYLLGLIAQRQNHLAKAKIHLMESLDIRRQLGEDHNGLIESLQKLGEVTFRLKEYDDAFRYYEECLAHSEKITNFYRTATILGAMGTGYLDLGRHREAMDCIHRCLALCTRSGFKKLHAHFQEILDRIDT